MSSGLFASCFLSSFQVQHFVYELGRLEGMGGHRGHLY